MVGSTTGPRIEIVVNPNAGQLRRGALLPAIRDLAQRRATVQVTQTLCELHQVARELAKTRPDIVAFCGGDGSFMAGVTALSAAYAGTPLPTLAFVPAGTVGTVARNWGGSRAALKQLGSLLEPSGPRDVQVKPCLRVTAGGREQIGFTFGTGLVARFFERYEAAGAGGLGPALGIVSRVFWGSFWSDAYSRSVLDPLPCRLSADGRPLPAAAYSLIVCSVLRDLGLHLRVTYRAEEDPERLHLVASSQPPRQLGPQAWRVLLGKPLVGGAGFDELVGSFTVEFTAGGAYILDGDRFVADRVEVRPGPQLRLMV